VSDSRQYRQQCKDYTIGFAAALFLSATVLAFPAVWLDWQATLFARAYTVFGAAGCVVLAIAYNRPMLFYEALEGGDAA